MSLDSSTWECECSSHNPYRKRICPKCGRPIPKSVIEQIYREESAVQEKYFYGDHLQKIRARWNKIGETMEKHQNNIYVYTIIIFLVCIGAMNALYENDMRDNAWNKLSNRVELGIERIQEMDDNFSGLKSLPHIVVTVLDNACTKTLNSGTEAVESITSKKIDKEKPEKVGEKIGKVFEYVTGKF